MFGGDTNVPNDGVGSNRGGLLRKRVGNVAVMLVAGKAGSRRREGEKESKTGRRSITIVGGVPSTIARDSLQPAAEAAGSPVSYSLSLVHNHSKHTSNYVIFFINCLFVDKNNRIVKIERFMYSNSTLTYLTKSQWLQEIFIYFVNVVFEINEFGEGFFCDSGVIKNARQNCSKSESCCCRTWHALRNR